MDTSRAEPTAPASLGVILTTSDPQRLRAILLFLAGAAVTERRVIVYVIGDGIQALASQQSATSVRSEGATGLGAEIPQVKELFTLLAELSVEFLICPSALVLADLSADSLGPYGRLGSVPEFLSATKGARLLSF